MAKTSSATRSSAPKASPKKSPAKSNKTAQARTADKPKETKESKKTDKAEEAKDPGKCDKAEVSEDAHKTPEDKRNERVDKLLEGLEAWLKESQEGEKEEKAESGGGGGCSGGGGSGEAGGAAPAAGAGQGGQPQDWNSRLEQDLMALRAAKNPMEKQAAHQRLQQDYSAALQMGVQLRPEVQMKVEAALGGGGQGQCGACGPKPGLGGLNAGQSGGNPLQRIGGMLAVGLVGFAGGAGRAA